MAESSGTRGAPSPQVVVTLLAILLGCVVGVAALAWTRDDSRNGSVLTSPTTVPILTRVAATATAAVSTPATATPRGR